MEHTPEPWELYKHMGEIKAIRMQVADGRGFCYWTPDNDHYPTREGDFYLIHAAPDLLDACKAHNAVGDHVQVCPRCGDGRACGEYDMLWNRADRLTRDALAKLEED